MADDALDVVPPTEQEMEDALTDVTETWIRAGEEHHKGGWCLPCDLWLSEHDDIYAHAATCPVCRAEAGAV